MTLMIMTIMMTNMDDEVDDDDYHTDSNNGIIAIQFNCYLFRCKLNTATPTARREDGTQDQV
jgi:hypothetical protein